MPKEIFGDDYVFLPKKELLSFEEIERFARIFASLGVKKLRLTGGEPLKRGMAIKRLQRSYIFPLKQLKRINLKLWKSFN